MQTTVENSDNQAKLDISPETSQEVKRVLESTGLNWAVRSEQLFSKDGHETKSAGIFRNDNNAWLGTVSLKYKPYQNEEMVETVVEASKQVGIDISTGGELDGGKRVFVQLGLDPVKIGQSTVSRYITALNSHNGLSSVAFGSTNYLSSSDSIFFKVYGELKKFRHAASTSLKIKAAVADLQKTIAEDIRIMDNFNLMTKVHLQDDILASVLDACFKIDLNTKDTDITTQKLKQVNTVKNCLDIEIKEEGQTLWALFNSVLRYTNHHASSKSNKKDYIMTGEGYKTNLRAYNTIVDYISKQQ